MSSSNSYKVCPQCKTSAPLNTESCANCGRAYKTKFEEPAERTQFYTPPTDPVLKVDLTPVAIQRRQTAPQVVAIILAVLLAGAGQICNGQYAKGAVILLICLVLWFWIPLIGLMIVFPVWLTCLIDTILISSRIVRGEVVGDWQFF